MCQTAKGPRRARIHPYLAGPTPETSAHQCCAVGIDLRHKVAINRPSVPQLLRSRGVPRAPIPLYPVGVPGTSVYGRERT